MNIKMMLAALGWFLFPSAAQAQPLGFARLSFVQGDVQIKTAEGKDWETAGLNVPLQAGDRIWCPDNSRAELQLDDGSLLRIDRNSSLDILKLESGQAQFHMGMGHLYLKSCRQNRKDFQIDFPDAAIRLGPHARFRVDLAQEGNLEVSIFDGRVYVESQNSKTTVRTGEKLILDEDSADVSPLNPPDAWERWNETRDRQVLARTVGTQYLPPELGIYAWTLDANGSWIYTDDYGYIWQPRVAFGADWAPYRLGRWAQMGGDYVWISYEPWGWAPYHYGRWCWRHDAWCWVPPHRGEVNWGPGYVGWTWSLSHVAWVPLAPAENYLGLNRFGPHGVDLRSPRSSERGVYRNAAVNQAVTLVTRNDFVRGQMLRQPFQVNPFTNGKVFGRPDFKSECPGTIGLGRPVPPGDRPTQRVLSATIANLRKQHPMIAKPAWEARPLHRQVTRLPHDARAEQWVEPEPGRGGHRIIREMPGYRGENSTRVIRRSWKVMSRDNGSVNGHDRSLEWQAKWVR